MYIPEKRKNHQITLFDFNQSCGMELDSDNEWIRLARIARKEYLALAKSKRRTEKKIRSTIRKQLGYVRRELGYLEDYMEAGYALPSKHMDCYLAIQRLYEQQKYMYENKTHRVEDRIVSISQPYLRPIVRGKAKSPVEFGAKYDVSIDEKGHARLEKLSFDAYNESTIFADAMNRYKERTGHYPKRVLADQIYRTRDNRNFCKKHNIAMSVLVTNLFAVDLSGFFCSIFQTIKQAKKRSIISLPSFSEDYFSVSLEKA